MTLELKEIKLVGTLSIKLNNGYEFEVELDEHKNLDYWIKHFKDKSWFKDEDGEVPLNV